MNPRSLRIRFLANVARWLRAFAEKVGRRAAPSADAPASDLAPERGGPPAHWLDLVRKNAPQLLRPGMGAKAPILPTNRTTPRRSIATSLPESATKSNDTTPLIQDEAAPRRMPQAAFDAMRSKITQSPLTLPPPPAIPPKRDDAGFCVSEVAAPLEPMRWPESGRVDPPSTAMRFSAQSENVDRTPLAPLIARDEIHRRTFDASQWPALPEKTPDEVADQPVEERSSRAFSRFTVENEVVSRVSSREHDPWSAASTESRREEPRWPAEAPSRSSTIEFPEIARPPSQAEFHFPQSIERATNRSSMNAAEALEEPADPWPALPEPREDDHAASFALSLRERDHARRLDLEQRGTPWSA